MYILEAKPKNPKVLPDDKEKTPVKDTPEEIEPKTPEEELPPSEDEQGEVTSDNPASGTTEPDQMQVQLQQDAAIQDEKILAQQIRVDQAYRLKYIFANLVSLSKLVDNYIHDDFEELRDTLNTGIELFKDVLIPNLGKYFEDLDNIIDDFDDFLKKSLDLFTDIVKKVEEKKNE